MGFQLLYWQYLRSINHPFLSLLDGSPQSFVGEDVELSLMLLSNYSSTTNLSRETHDASDAYQKLGLLSQIAKEVRDYKVSRFGGVSETRSPVQYDGSSQEVIAATDFIRKFIDKTEERGLFTYKLQTKNKPIPKRFVARQDALFHINVSQLDLHWQPFAISMIQRHLKALNEQSYKVSQDFNRRFLEQFADLYSFDDEALERFPVVDVDSDSSLDELPLAGEEWQKKMAALIPVDYSEAAEAEAKERRDTKRRERKDKPADPTRVPKPKRKPGRPRKRLAPPTTSPPTEPSTESSQSVQVAPAAPAPAKRGRGRPRGSRNKKTLLRLAQTTVTQPRKKVKKQASAVAAEATAAPEAETTAVFDSNQPRWFSL